METNRYGLQEYFNYLHNMGYVQFAAVLLLLLFNFIQEMQKSYEKGEISLDSDDKLVMQSYLECLKSSNCFIKVRDLYNMCCR